jgi:hypothetical protein
VKLREARDPSAVQRVDAELAIEQFRCSRSIRAAATPLLSPVHASYGVLGHETRPKVATDAVSPVAQLPPDARGAVGATRALVNDADLCEQFLVRHLARRRAPRPVRA